VAAVSMLSAQMLFVFKK